MSLAPMNCLETEYRWTRNQEYFDEIRKYLERDPGTAWGPGHVNGSGGVTLPPVTLSFAFEGGIRTYTLSETQGALEHCVGEHRREFSAADTVYRNCVGEHVCN
jgi:hypothetical protein